MLLKILKLRLHNNYKLNVQYEYKFCLNFKFLIVKKVIFLLSFANLFGFTLYSRRAKKIVLRFAKA